MDIVQQLENLAQSLRDEFGCLSPASLLIQQVAQMIATQPRLESERFLAHYNAALTGILSGVRHPIDANDIVQCISGAKRFACLSMAVQWKSET